MANILDDNTTYIPENSASSILPLPEDAPMQAASGNLGGLQASLIGKSDQIPLNTGGLTLATAPNVPSKSSNQPFGLDAQEEYRKAISDRIRSPEAIASALADRKGALQKLQEANSKPLNDWTSDKYFAEGVANSTETGDPSRTFSAGLANQFAGEREKQMLARQSNIANAQAGVDFQKGEENISGGREHDVLADAAKMFSATRFKNGGMLNVPGRGLVDLNQLDEQGNPKIVLDSGKVSSLVADATAQAQKQAYAKEGTGELNFGTGSDAADKRNAWIRQTAKYLATPSLAALNIHPGAVDDMFNGAPMTQQSTPQKYYIGNQEVTKNQLDQLKLENHPDKITPIDPTKPLVPLASTNQPNIQPETMPIGTPTAIAATNKAMAESGATEYSDIKKQAIGAQQVLSTTRDLSSLPSTETGILSNIKMKLGDYAAAFGIAPDLASKAVDLHTINTQLERHIAQQLQTLNKGSASNEDVQRYREMMPSVNDQVAQYRYNLAHSREIALRQISQANSYDKTTSDNMSSPDVRMQALPIKNAASNWQTENERLGPNSIPMSDHSSYFRSEALADTIRQTTAANPQKSVADITKAFDKAWKNNPSLFQH
jgi:hypothetical protein